MTTKKARVGRPVNGLVRLAHDWDDRADIAERACEMASPETRNAQASASAAMRYCAAALRKWAKANNSMTGG